MSDNPAAIFDSPTELEHSIYSNFVREQLSLIHPVNSSTPSQLWHYTNADGLIGILQSGELWSTHVSCLNDQMELRYSRRLLLNKIIEVSNGIVSKEGMRFLELVKLRLAEDDTTTSEWFVTSFSTKMDDLSQWRAYGFGEGGYAIGFDFSKLNDRNKVDNADIVPICYDIETQSDIAKNVAQMTLRYFLQGLSGKDRNFETWSEKFLIEWGKHLTYLAPLIKHPKFFEEHEWRLVRQLRPNEHTKLTYRSKSTMIARHLPLKLSEPDKILPITKIIVGPSRNKNVSRISVGDLLKSSLYPDGKVQVVESEVPFQNV